MNKKHVFTFIALLLVATIGLSACTMLPVQPADATNESAQSDSAPLRTLSVTGTGKVMLVPDLAYINIGVRSEAQDVSSALAANNAQATAITDAIKATGVEEKDLQTANFNVYSIQQYDQMGQPSYVSYSVENTLYVTVRDLTKLSQVLDAALSAGAAGAKLSGGGGGGNVIAVVTPENTDAVIEAFHTEGAVEVIVTHIPGQPGVQP
jgi:hypothetical protein